VDAELPQEVEIMIERRAEKTVKHIHEGKYAAYVQITLHYDGSGWDPTIDREDVEKLERVRVALRRGDIAAAARHGEVFELTKVA
jgi:hypothetical protein